MILETRAAASQRSGEVTEGVGFEPTVGFPTLDFESSALNRTQPPFLESEKENVERPTSNIQLRMQLPSTLGVQRWTLGVHEAKKSAVWRSDGIWEWRSAAR